MNSPAPNWLKGRAVRYHMRIECFSKALRLTPGPPGRPLIQGDEPNEDPIEVWIVADERDAARIIEAEHRAGKTLLRGQVWTWAEVHELNRLEVEDAREAGAWKLKLNGVVAEARRLQ